MWEALAYGLPSAGNAFAEGILAKRAADERQKAHDFDVKQFEFRKQQHADALRQDEVDRANKMLGLDAGPVNFNVKEPSPPASIEALATRLLQGGLSADDPQLQNLVNADRLFNPQTQSAAAINAGKLPDIGGEFIDEATKLLGDWDKQRGQTERAESVKLSDPRTGAIQYVRPKFGVPKPDIESLWWSKYVPRAGSLGLDADSIRQNLVRMYPGLNADRRPGVNMQPVDPGSSLMRQGQMQAMGMGGGQPSTPPPANDGSFSDEEYQRFVEKWNRGEIR